MDQATQQNAAMVEQTTAASHGLTAEADELAKLVSQFEIGGASAVPEREVRRANAGNAARGTGRARVAAREAVLL
jgi:methyl-accepting chemotaxis protein